MIQKIYDMLDALGVRVSYADLPPDRDGEYIHKLRLIRLQRDMATRLHNSTLAHEAGHAVFSDVLSKFGPVNAKQERRADEWAAMRLITLDAYREAERHHGGHVEAMAVELGTTVDLVVAFQRVLLRIGDTVYVRPRMGAGMWDHKEQVV